MQQHQLKLNGQLEKHQFQLHAATPKNIINLIQENKQLKQSFKNSLNNYFDSIQSHPNLADKITSYKGLNKSLINNSILKNIKAAHTLASSPREGLPPIKLKTDLNQSFDTVRVVRSRQQRQVQSLINSPERTINNVSGVELPSNILMRRIPESFSSNVSPTSRPPHWNSLGKTDKFTCGFMKIMYQDTTLHNATRQKNMNTIRLEKLKKTEELQRLFEEELREKRELVEYYKNNYGVMCENYLVRQMPKADLLILLQKRATYRKQYLAARKIQRSYRSHVKRIRDRANEALELQTKYARACRAIQKWYRQRRQNILANKLIEEKRTQAAITIQRIFRGYQVRKHTDSQLKKQKLSRNFLYFFEMRQKLLEHVQIIIRYHWTKYKKNKLKKKRNQGRRNNARAKVNTNLKSKKHIPISNSNLTSYNGQQSAVEQTPSNAGSQSNVSMGTPMSRKSQAVKNSPVGPSNSQNFSKVMDQVVHQLMPQSSFSKKQRNQTVIQKKDKSSHIAANQANTTPLIKPQVVQAAQNFKNLVQKKASKVEQPHDQNKQVTNERQSAKGQLRILLKDTNRVSSLNQSPDNVSSVDNQEVTKGDEQQETNPNNIEPYIEDTEEDQEEDEENFDSQRGSKEDFENTMKQFSLIQKSDGLDNIQEVNENDEQTKTYAKLMESQGDNVVIQEQ